MSDKSPDDETGTMKSFGQKMGHLGLVSIQKGGRRVSHHLEGTHKKVTLALKKNRQGKMKGRGSRRRISGEWGRKG